MIRINLFPQKRRAPRSPADYWAAAGGLVLVLQIAACFIIHGIKTEELAERQGQNVALGQEIDKLKKAVKEHAAVKEKLSQLKAREDAILSLQSARTGPTAMLLEIARILTPGRGPSVDAAELSRLRRENPLQDYNSNWDTRRLWLLRLVESARQVRLDGLARDGEDVSELARRMNLSTYFSDVTLLPAKRASDTKSGLPMVAFQLEAKVSY